MTDKELIEIMGEEEYLRMMEEADSFETIICDPVEYGAYEPIEENNLDNYFRGLFNEDGYVPFDKVEDFLEGK